MYQFYPTKIHCLVLTSCQRRQKTRLAFQNHNQEFCLISGTMTFSCDHFDGSLGLSVNSIYQFNLVTSVINQALNSVLHIQLTFVLPHLTYMFPPKKKKKKAQCTAFSVDSLTYTLLKCPSRLRGWNNIRVFAHTQPSSNIQTLWLG